MQQTSTTLQIDGQPAVTPAPETDLFNRFLAGDDAAFVEFYDRYDRRLRLYCLKVIGDVQVSEDITQGVWERVIRMRLNPVEITQPAHYLMRMVRNACLKHLQRRRPVDSLDDLNERDHPSESVHEPSHLEELVSIAVGQLPEDQREVIVLHNYCGYSYEDVAAMRGETLGSVKMRAMRARSRMGRMISAFLALGKEGEIDGRNFIEESTT